MNRRHKKEKARNHHCFAAENVADGPVKKRHCGKADEVGRQRLLHGLHRHAKDLRHLVKARQVHVGRKRPDHGTGRQKPGEDKGIDLGLNAICAARVFLSFSHELNSGKYAGILRPVQSDSRQSDDLHTGVCPKKNAPGGRLLL